MGMWHALGMLITSADLADLRRLEKGWVTAQPVDMAAWRCEFQAHLLNNAPALLAATEAINSIRAIAAEENDLGDFSRRVGVVLAELECGK